MQINYLIDKIIDYAIFNNAHTIDVDITPDNSEVTIISKDKKETILSNNESYDNLQEGLEIINQEDFFYKNNNCPYAIKTTTYKKPNSVRVFLEISNHPLTLSSLNDLKFSNSDISLIKSNLNSERSLNIIISEDYTNTSNILYNIASHQNNHNSNIYVFDKFKTINIEGVHQIPYSPNEQDIFHLLHSHSPSLLLLNNPTFETIKKCLTLTNKGIPTGITLNSHSITEAILKLISEKISSVNLADILNLIIFQTNNPNKQVKLFKTNNITRNTLKHPRLSQALLHKAINQNLLEKKYNKLVAQ